VTRIPTATVAIHVPTLEISAPAHSRVNRCWRNGARPGGSGTAGPYRLSRAWPCWPGRSGHARCSAGYPPRDARSGRDVRSARCGEPRRAGDAGAAEPAVPVGVHGEVLLVVILRVIEGSGGCDLGRYLAVARLREHFLVASAGTNRGEVLVLGRPVDARAVLR